MSCLTPGRMFDVNDALTLKRLFHPIKHNTKAFTDIVTFEIV